jgi:hypothetical protein
LLAAFVVEASCTSTSAVDSASTNRQVSSVTGGSVATVDCNEIIIAIKARRGVAAHSAALARAQAIRTDSPHLDIPIDDLVKFHAPIFGQGRGATFEQNDNLDVLTRHVLCDPLMLETVSQSYLTEHPELRL